MGKRSGLKKQNRRIKKKKFVDGVANKYSGLGTEL